MAQTLSEISYLAIKKKIIKGEYDSGTHLVEAQLTKDLGMSRTPIRNALSRLVSEGFLIYQNHCGITVAKLDTSFEDLLDFLEIRQIFIMQSIKKAEIKSVKFDILKLKGYFIEYKDALKDDDVEKFYLNLWKIHDTLLLPAQNRIMLEVMKNFQNKILLGSTKYTYMKRKPYLQEQIELLELFIESLEEENFQDAMILVDRITRAIIMSLL
ncbi:GntR family transcriptional regulator [Bacillus paranthracis]|uniref:GntR family transcriptional regulator n=1 Tax=Bacillus paranthracis TaxID=2026186 RepID=A0AAJ1K8E9_9BACI|nr:MULTISPECIES: GntR family transcriptional regulator [Bacillus cereus group]ADY24866.1 transcriptional regulator, GntR family protein [Bacillus thuringiensis serovar finitimus YBT-020]MRC73994.1 GntR family transcriptional regulator [Bacillus thuringiensis]OTX71529.1 GntR family transcriptional regulator [Bacillus thuringiensis serovar finitimus]MDG0950920.1 GntR family transcriptional regulator [Bacillus paranthracis]MDG0956608.1 GntR family transcriptional regulator [Bacillus paranthracis]